jgi:hypothetical protein
MAGRIQIDVSLLDVRLLPDAEADNEGQVAAASRLSLMSAGHMGPAMDPTEPCGRPPSSAAFILHRSWHRTPRNIRYTSHSLDLLPSPDVAHQGTPPIGGDHVQ